MNQPLLVLAGFLKITEDVFDENYSRIHDDAEIDGADREKVGALAAQHQEDEGEKQGKRYVEADNDGAAQIAQENPLDEKNQQATENEIVQHGVGGHGNQVPAIVKRHDLDPWWQAAVGVHSGDFLFHFRDHVVSMLGAVHHHD